MPKRFLQTEYEKLSKAELIKAIYTIGDKHNQLQAIHQSVVQDLRNTRFKARKAKFRITQLNQSIRSLRQRVVELTPVKS